MKMKLISLACLSTFSGFAAAEISTTITSTPQPLTVSVYGVLDIGIISANNLSNPALGYLPNTANKGSFFGMKDGGIGQSFWGIKGGMDFGGGLKSTVTLEGNFQSVSGTTGGPNSSATTSFFNRQANLGLAGDFGDVKAGRIISPVYYALQSTDVRGAAYFGSALTALVGLNSASGQFVGNNSNASYGAIFNDNAIVYTTPEFNGFTGRFAHVFGNVAGNNTALRQDVATALYNSKNLKLDAIYYTGHDDGATASATPNGTNTNQLFSFGAMYTIDQYSIAAGYYKGKNPNNSGAGVNPGPLGGAVTSGNLDMYTFGLGYRYSQKTNLTSGVYHIKDENHTSNKSTLYSVGLNYQPYKQTTLYAEAAHVSNTGSNMNQAPAYGMPVTAGISSRAYMVGVRQAF
jgi:predicted porin